MQFFCSADISQNISVTHEGFLVCKDVAITRVGELDYLHSEVPVERGSSQITKIERTEEDVFDEACMRSFEGKSLTLGHPKEFVTPDNWKALTVGMMHNVRKGTDHRAGKLLADILVTDAVAIGKIMRKELREVSCGYNAEYKDIAPGRGRQTMIRGNHVALVPRGRAGPECAIYDSAPKDIEMTTLKDKLLGALSKAFDADPAFMKKVDEEEEDKTSDAFKLKLKKAEEDKAAADKKASDAQTALDAANAALSSMKATVDGLKVEVDALKKPAAPAKVTNDAAVISAAEILCPGIATDSATIKVDALKAAYATADGKVVIDGITGQSVFPATDNAAVTDLLFNAAVAGTKAARNANLAKPPVKTGDGGEKVLSFADAWNEKASKMYKVGA